MGLFKRIMNVITGKANKAIDSMENPIEMLELEIRRRKDAVANAKIQSAKYIGSVSDKEQDVKKLESKIKDYELGIRKALEKGDEDKAKQFVESKIQLTNDLEVAKGVYAKIKASADSTKSDIKKLEKDIQQLEGRKHELSARLSTAEAKAKVGEIISNVNSASSISIDDIEAKVKEKENYADGLSEFAPVDVDAELRDYVSKSDADVESELEKIRRDMGLSVDKETESTDSL